MLVVGDFVFKDLRKHSKKFVSRWNVIWYYIGDGSQDEWAVKWFLCVCGNPNCMVLVGFKEYLERSGETKSHTVLSFDEFGLYIIIIERHVCPFFHTSRGWIMAIC